MTETSQPSEPLWTVVANMTSQPRNGSEAGRRYTGTPIFSAGTKLYLGYVYVGANEKLHAIGRGRNSARLVNSVIDLRLLVNVRPNLVYSPGRLKSLKRLEAFLSDNREAAETFSNQIAASIQWLLNKPWRNDAGSAE
jgi:hypothetical protein